MRFGDVVGQQETKQGLIRMWEHNQLPHAILITGAEGTGGLPLGLALAQYIMCEHRTETDSCGVCANCTKITRLEHADLHLSFPSTKWKERHPTVSRNYIREFREFVKQTPYGTVYEWLQFIEAENKQGNLSADECNEILERLNLKTYEGGSKVLVMWRPEYLGKEGNKLLKMIEEPPANTFLIFVAEQPEDILATIRSRTQTIKLPPLKTNDIADALIRRSGTDTLQAARVAALAMGSYNRALEYNHSTENDLFEDVRKLFNGLYKNNGVDLTSLSEDWSKKGREQQKFALLYVVHLLENALRHTYLGNQPVNLPQVEADFVSKLVAMHIEAESIAAMVDTITNTIYYIERNAHQKTQMLAMMIRLHYIVQRKEIPV